MIKNIVTVMLLGMCLLGNAWTCYAADLLNLGRGINLGNKLESPKDQPWGKLEAWNFKKAKEGGFDTVRLPARWHEYTQETEPYAIEQEFFSTVEWALNEAIANGLNIVLNMHHFNPLFDNPRAEKARFLAVWRQIAERFKDMPIDRVVFEVMNEPNTNLTAELWNEYFAEALTIIRETNPNRYVMVGPAEWGGVGAMRKLQIPDDKRLIFTFHYYEPAQFTHQGAEWVDGSENWVGTRWTATNEQQAAIRKHFDDVAGWAKTHNNIPVFPGEFGVYKKTALPEDQMRWVGFVAREAEKHGFSWAYWEFNSGFGCYGLNESDGWNYLHHTLIP